MFKLLIVKDGELTLDTYKAVITRNVRVNEKGVLFDINFINGKNGLELHVVAPPQKYDSLKAMLSDMLSGQAGHIEFVKRKKNSANKLEYDIASAQLVWPTEGN